MALEKSVSFRLMDDKDVNTATWRNAVGLRAAADGRHLELRESSVHTELPDEKTMELHHGLRAAAVLLDPELFPQVPSEELRASRPAQVTCPPTPGLSS